MKTLTQVMGALSRDMLFLHGHIVSVRGLEGSAQRSTYPAPAPRENQRKPRHTETASTATACKAHPC